MTDILSPYHGIFSVAAAADCAHKPAFSSLPQQVVVDLCTLVQAGAITSADVGNGGVSASASFLLTFDNGRKLFVKGSHPGDQSHGAANLRGECMAYRTLDILQDIAPPFCGMVHLDRGDDNGWWLGAWQQVDQLPQAYDASALFKLLDDIQHSDVPASAALPIASAHPYLSQFTSDTYKWRRLRDDASRAQKFAHSFADPAAVQSWLATHIDKLCDLQHRASTYAWRLGLMHGDLRCDNFIYGALAGQLPRWFVIDWANAADGALAFDRVMLAASLLAQGSFDRAAALQHARGDLPVEDIQLMLLMQAGYFADQLYRAPPAAMPRLRPIQKAMFAALVTMLAAENVVADMPSPLA